MLKPSHLLSITSVLVASALAVSGCSLDKSGHASLNVAIESQAAGLQSRNASTLKCDNPEEQDCEIERPSEVEGFDCYAVNVMGPGITSAPTLGSMRCDQPGITSVLIPNTGGNVSLDVPTGPDRIVQMVGIKMQEGKACPIGSDLMKLDWNQAQMVEVGRESVNLFSDTAVEIRSTYDKSSSPGAFSCGNSRTVPGPPSKLSFTTDQQTVVAGECSSSVTVVTRDDFGNPAAVTADTDVELSGAGGGITFYSYSACTTPVTSMTFAQGTSMASFYFKSTLAGTHDITVASTLLTSASQNITTQPNTPVKVGFTTLSQTVAREGCSEVVTVQAQDTFSNASLLISATTIALSGNTGISFFSTADCHAGTQITEVLIPSGSSAGFYFSSTTSGTISIKASAPGFPDNTQLQMISP